MLRAKTLFTYGALVVLPLLALTSVLSFGRSLHAPPAVAGTWKMDTTKSIRECTGMLLTQSGTDVTIVLQDARHTTLTGIIRNHRILAPQLDALVTSAGSEERLSGSYRDKPFTAVLVNPLRKEI